MIDIGKFYLLTHFYVVNDNGRSNLQIILRRLLLQMGGAFIDVMHRTLTFNVSGEKQKFQVCQNLTTKDENKRKDKATGVE